MDYQGLFLTAQFLNDRKKASRKEITAFLAKSINASQSKADALINALAASATILNLASRKNRTRDIRDKSSRRKNTKRQGRAAKFYAKTR